MASKSKKRRRVFRASCILAALIIAGSSFAWFTSKDEVTNRLTATSDYGVSIVESFVPPANWLPGQAINKEVYAVNTGNVAAFVNEDISGVLNYTYEQKTKDLSDKCVILNDVENGAVTYEAGGFLAWTDAEVSKTVPKYTIGDIEYTKEIVSTELTNTSGNNPKTFTAKYTNPADSSDVYYSLVEDNGDGEEERAYRIETLSEVDHYSNASTLVTTGEQVVKDGAVDVGAVNVLIGEENGWKPTEEGAYIFRRAIKNDINPGSGETYTYSGFYFVPAGTEVSGEALEEDTYYKIIIGNDTYSTTVADADHDGIADIVFDIYADQAEVQTLGATINEDGTINGTVDYNFVEVESTGNQDVTLVMDDPNHRLIAVYSKAASGQTDGNGDPYDASAVAARAEVDYENAEKLSNLADTLYSYAQADVAYAKKIAEERNKLIDAADATKAAHDALDAAKTAKDDAWNDVFGSGEAYNAFKDAFTTFTTSGAPNSLATLQPDKDANGFVPKNVRDAATDAHPQVKNNYDQLVALYGALNGSTDGSIMKSVKAINDAIAVLDGADYQGDATDKETLPKNIQDQLDIIKNNLDLLYNENTGLLKQYKDKYADIVNSVATDSTLNIQTVNPDEQKNRIEGVRTLCGDAVTAENALQVAEDGYKDAYDAWQTEVTDAGNQDTAWAQALRDYNTNVGKAKDDYEEALKKGDSTGTLYGQNHGTTIAPKGTDGSASVLGKTPGYSLTNRGAGDDPTIKLTGGSDPENEAANDYNTYLSSVVFKYDESEATIKTNLPMNYTYTTTEVDPSDTNTDNAPYHYIQATDATVGDRFAQVESLKNTSNAAKVAADQAYANAVSALQGTSDIMIYINLANDAATETSPAYKWSDSWTFDESTNNSKKASFYYNKVLEPGETTEKLVDSVELAGSVKATDYKDLTFDLNVAMDSAQVTYEDDQKTYTAKAVQKDAFGMKVASIENNEDVTWENYDAAAMVTQYNLSGVTDPVTLEKVSWLKDTVTYNWVAKVDNDYYVGTSRADGSTFKKATVTTDGEGKPNGISAIADESNDKTLTVSRVAAPTTP